MSLINESISSSSISNLTKLITLKPTTLANLNAKVSRAVQFGKYIVVSGAVGAGVGFVATVGAAGGLVIGILGGISTGVLLFIVKRNREIRKEQEEIKNQLKENNKVILTTCEEVNQIADRLLETQFEIKKDIEQVEGNVNSAETNINNALSQASKVVDLCDESIEIAKNIEEIFTNAIQKEEENKIEAEVIQPKVEVNKAVAAAERLQRLKAQSINVILPKKEKSIEEMSMDDFANELLETLNEDNKKNLQQEKAEFNNEFDFLDDALNSYCTSAKSANLNQKVNQQGFTQVMHQFEEQKRDALFCGVKRINLDETLKDLSQLRTNFETAKSTINKLQIELESAQSELTRAKANLSAGDQKVQSMENEIQRLKKEIQTLTEKTRENDRKIGELQTEDSTENLFLSFGAGVAITAMVAKIL
ncbi:MAG: hypothetical protein Q8K60_08015 [Parachlamydiaceae bacterium]|nr:hypothetical protein [Parachlamydiaceae bacterium]